MLYRLCLAFILRDRSLQCGFGGRCVPAEETAIDCRYSELGPKGISSVHTAHCTCMCVHVYMQWYMYICSGTCIYAVVHVYIYVRVESIVVIWIEVCMRV